MTAAGGAGFRLLRLDVAPAPEAALPATRPPPGRSLPGRSALSVVAELLVPAAGGPLFAGHFPGRPLLPGIAHLALLCQVLEELAARGTLGGAAPGNTSIAEVHWFRLRREIVPGDRIELRVEGWAEAGTGGGAFRFELRRQAAAGQPGGIASEGTVRTGIGDGRPRSAAPIPRPDLEPGGPFRPMADLIPHAPPSRLLTEVLAGGAGAILCTGSIPVDHPLAAGGEAPGFLAIELGAQAAAALEALARPPGGRPRIGYLVGVRDAHLPARLPTGRTLHVTAVPAGAAAPLAIYDMQVAAEGAAERLAAGTISTFLAEP
jgi:predicted hotdog family 3-hydroxylacyl-ACP dehydratase